MARTYGEANYGEAFYGVTKYVDGEIAAAPSASVSAAAQVVYNNVANIQQTSGAATVSAEAIRLVPGIILAECEASVAANAEAIYSVSVTIDGEAAFDATAFYTAKGVALIEAESSVPASAREKWEPLAETPETWTRID